MIGILETVFGVRSYLHSLMILDREWRLEQGEFQLAVHFTEILKKTRIESDCNHKNEYPYIIYTLYCEETFLLLNKIQEKFNNRIIVGKPCGNQGHRKRYIMYSSNLYLVSPFELHKMGRKMRINKTYCSVMELETYCNTTFVTLG